MKRDQYIKSLRMALKMTQEQMSKALKTRQSTVSSWERMTRKPSSLHALHIIKLCRKHGIEATLEDLIAD